MPGYLILLRRTTVERAATYVEAGNEEAAGDIALEKVDNTPLIWEQEKNSSGRAHVAVIEQVSRR